MPNALLQAIKVAGALGRGAGCGSVYVQGRDKSQHLNTGTNTYGDNGQKLRQIKAEYDPTNMFNSIENGMSSSTVIHPADEETKESEFVPPKDKGWFG